LGDEVRVIRFELPTVILRASGSRQALRSHDGRIANSVLARFWLPAVRK
jgi:hypothetical protein